MWSTLKRAFNYIGLFFKQAFQSPVLMAGFGVLILIIGLLYFQVRIGDLESALESEEQRTAELTSQLRAREFSIELDRLLYRDLQTWNERIESELRRIDDLREDVDLDQLRAEIEKEVRQEIDEGEHDNELDYQLLYLSYLRLNRDFSISATERMWDFYEQGVDSDDRNRP